MAYCKKFLSLFLILFILLFNCSFVFASEVEELERSTSQVSISPDRNYFSTSDVNTSYIHMEVGYKYTIVYDEVSDPGYPDRYIAVSDEAPTLNGIYTYLGSVSSGNSYSYIPSTDSYFLCVYRNNWDYIHFYREKLDSQENAINDLVNNVGPNALWGVFGSGIDFVFIVVIVAFGLFIIYRLIKGLSKGKSKI